MTRQPAGVRHGTVMTQAARPLIALVVLALAIAATGYVVFQYGKEAIKLEKQGELAAIAHLKITEIARWIAEQRAYAVTFGRNSFLAVEAEEWLRRGAPSDETGRRVLARMRSFTDTGGYRLVTLVDTQGQARLSTDGRLPVEYPTRATAIESMHTRTPLLSELYRAGSGEIAIDLLSPLLLSEGGATRTVGALVLTIDPHQYLFPLIESWPEYMRSGETLLVRREGDEVVFLNELRHRKDTALRLRLPLAETELPAAMVARGQEGVVEGRDYRGVPVLAALHKIPASPWFMVAKVDTDEVYAGIRTLAWTVTTLVCVFVAVTGAAIMLWWRRQYALHLAAQYRLALEREALVRHFDYLAKYANDIILLLDEQGRIVEVNDRAVSAYGYTRDELLQHHIRDLRAPETLAAFESQFQRAAEPGGVLFETVHRRKDGTPFPVEVSSRTFMVESRTFYQSIIRDIADRKQAEEALKRERDFAEGLIETAQAIVLVLDTEGRIVRFNPFMEMLSGYRLEGVQGQDWFTTFLPEGDRSRTREVFSRAMSDIQTRGNINPIVTRDGHTRDISWSDKTLKDPDGNTVGLLSIGHDVTDLLRAETALRDREERLELILASAGEGIFGMDGGDHFTFANRAAVKMLGYRNEQELLGQDAHQLIHYARADGTPYPKEDCPLHLARGQNKVIHLDDKVIHSDDEVLWRADGSHFPAEYQSYPMIRDDRVIGRVVTFTDITERKEKEAQLRQAQKMEVVGQLTGGIAHDFNNLLTVILANLGLLGEEIGSDAGGSSRELIDDALSAARDGAALTNRLLAFSRKQSLQVQRTDVGEFLRNIRRFLQRTLREDIELRMNRAKDALPVLVDPGQLESALLNLVVNARDAMPKGGSLIIETTRKRIGAEEASAEPELAPGNYITITVRDSGIGMSPEDAARAIEPFFTTKPRGKGSGLGLSMVYGFAKQSGGGLLLRSVLGEGTTVSMLLPEAAPPIENDGAEPTPRSLPGGSETILLVEDESQVRKVARRILLGLGYQVIEVENAAAARKVCEEETAVDLLFSDIVLRGDMNGRELARWASERCSGLKVLLTTGFSEEETGELPVEEGGFHVLRKPYLKGELAAAARAVLDGGAVRRSRQ
jgi:two-component system cell cycle sensor histidine kinase/response regulator CckA